MNILENFLIGLQLKMDRPTSYDYFHILCLILVIVFIIILYAQRKKYSEKQLKLVLGIYGITAFILELLKQLMWSVELDPLTNMVVWDYNWYAAPFQFCTTPIYISLIALFLKKSTLRDYLLSYMAYFTILGSITTMLYPESCFTSDILINIHTMFLHGGSLVVSIYLLFTKEVLLKYENLLKGFIVFLVFVFIANTMNITFYLSGLIGNETFDMFYISPYFESILPVFNIIEPMVPYVVFLLIYMFACFLGGHLIYFISMGINKLFNKDKK